MQILDEGFGVNWPQINWPFGAVTNSRMKQMTWNLAREDLLQCTFGFC